MRIVQISDTHLTHRGGVTNRNFELLADFVNDVLQPDLIVNSGDIALLSPDSSEDRETAYMLHGRFRSRVRFVPGNHDVGEPGDSPWEGLGVSSERIRGYRSVLARISGWTPRPSWRSLA